MARRYPEVMIQDVNPLNARIYFHNYMYVGGRRMIARPRYFAPHFTQGCESDPNLIDVQEAGVSWISEILTVRELTVRELQMDPEIGADPLIRAHEHWHRWRWGLQAIGKRAMEEPFSEESDPHRLYFLNTPIKLSWMIKKRPEFPMIPPGFGLPTLEDLRNRKEL